MACCTSSSSCYGGSLQAGVVVEPRSLADGVAVSTVPGAAGGDPGGANLDVQVFSAQAAEYTRARSFTPFDR